MATIKFEAELTVLSCKCGITYAVPEEWRKDKLRTHAIWCCPNGCRRHYPGESDIERAQREAREKQAALNEANHLKLVAARQRDKAIAEKKRLEKRVSAGVCPCCNRTFSDLARHMKSKHKGGIDGGNQPKLIASAIQ